MANILPNFYNASHQKTWEKDCLNISQEIESATAQFYHFSNKKISYDMSKFFHQ